MIKKHRSYYIDVEYDNAVCLYALGLIVSKGSGSCLNQIFGFELENDTKSIVSIIGPQNVGSLEPLFDPDM